MSGKTDKEKSYIIVAVDANKITGKIDCAVHGPCDKNTAYRLRYLLKQKWAYVSVRKLQNANV